MSLPAQYSVRWAALSGCESLAELADIQERMQKPMAPKLGKANFAKSQSLVMETFHRISGDNAGEGEVE